MFGAQCRTCGHEPEHHRQTDLIRYAGRTALPVGRAECLALQPFPSRKPCLCPRYKAPAAESRHDGSTQK